MTAAPDSSIAIEPRKRGPLEILGLSRADAIVIGVLAFITLIIGATAIALTIDVPGDGPSHAMIAYGWSRHPIFKTNGVWLPGFDYWAGLWLILIPDPFLAPRLCNLTFTTLTIPVFYAIVRKLYGSSEAILATVAFVAVPLRIGLGASSLTEVSSIFFLLAGILCLMYAVESGSIDIRWFAVALAFLVAAEMTRYEVWAFAPLFIIYLYVRTRSLSASAIALIIFIIFPFLWSWGNYRSSGAFFPGLLIPFKAPEGTNPVGLKEALVIVSHLLRDHIGWLLSVGALIGLMCELTSALPGRIQVDRASYAIFVAIVWASILSGALSRGSGLYPRYLLLGFILALPLAAVAYMRVAGGFRFNLVTGLVLIAISMVTPYRQLRRLDSQWCPFFVTTRIPNDIVAISRWLPTSSYRDDALLMTKLDWDSSYLWLYQPELYDRSLVVSVWISEASIRQFVESHHPALLLTRERDSAGIALLDDAMGRKIEPLLHDPVFTSGTLEVYSIEDFSKAGTTDP